MNENLNSVYSHPIPPLGPSRGGRGCNQDDWNAFDNRIYAKRTLGEIKLLCHMDPNKAREVNFTAGSKSSSIGIVTLAF